MIPDRTEQLEKLYAERIRPPAEASASNGHRSHPDVLLSDEKILDLCRRAGNGGKFTRLYDFGAIAEYGDDHSRADQALISMMSFYTQDVDQLDRLFRSSELCREKWTGRADYRRRTIDRALRDLTDVYRPAGGPSSSRNGHEGHRNSSKTKEASYGRGPAISRVEETRRPAPLPEVLAFPVDALPEECRAFVSEGAGAIGCPPEFLAMPALASLSSGIGASRVVEIKRSWREGAALFLSVVAPPGAKKTPASKAATEPVRKRQAQLAREYRAKMDAYERELREWEVAKKLAYKDNQPAPAQPGRPVMERVIADDTTVEALVGILENNPRGLLIDKDELTGWVRAMDQYKGGKGADRQHWLSIWSSKAVVVDRKSRAGEPVIIDRPWVSLFGGIQPAMLKELSGGQEDGLLDRFLFAYPKPQRTLFSESEISHEAEADYAGLYKKLLSLEMVEDEHGAPNPGIVPMERDARERFREIVDAMSSEVFEPGFPARLAGVWSKMEGYLARISLVLALSRCVSTGEVEHVSLADVEAAGKLLEYFKVHARRVYAELKTATPEDLLAGEIRDLLSEQGGSWVGSATELHDLLTEREAEGLPDNPDWLTRAVLAIAGRTESLEARRKKSGSKRTLSLTLKNSVPGVPSAPNGIDKPDSERDTRDGKARGVPERVPDGHTERDTRGTRDTKSLQMSQKSGHPASAMERVCKHDVVGGCWLCRREIEKLAGEGMSEESAWAEVLGVEVEL